MWLGSDAGAGSMQQPPPSLLRLTLLPLLAAAAATPPRRGSLVTPELVAWFEQRGYSAAVPKAQPRDGGLFVRRGATISAGEIIAAIPPSLILSPATVLGTDTRLPDTVALPMWLSLERHRPGSPWGPYLRSLPSSFDLPFLWPAAERAAALRPSSRLAADVEADIAMVQATYNRHMGPFCRRLPPAVAASASAQGMCAFSTWQWAWAVSWSRALGIPRAAFVAAAEGTGSGRRAIPPEQESSNGMIPLLDMANHRSGAAVRARWDHVRGLLTVVSTAALRGGEEIFIDYNHDWGSAAFLQHYGFVHDRVDLAYDVATLPRTAFAEVLLPAGRDTSRGVRCLMALLLRQGGVAISSPHDDLRQRESLWCDLEPLQLGVEAVGAAHASSSETLRALLLLGAARALPAQTAASLAAEGVATERTTPGAGQKHVAATLRKQIGRGRGSTLRLAALAEVVAITERWLAWHTSGASRAPGNPHPREAGEQDLVTDAVPSPRHRIVMIGALD